MIDGVYDLHRLQEFITFIVARVLLADSIGYEGDRVYHAKDGTWWKRVGDRIVAADPPPGWVKATTCANHAPTDATWEWRTSDGSGIHTAG